MNGNLAKRVELLEDQSAPVGRIRTCWKGKEPADLRPGDTLYCLSWIDEGEDEE